MLIFILHDCPMIVITQFLYSFSVKKKWKININITEINMDIQIVVNAVLTVFVLRCIQALSCSDSPQRNNPQISNSAHSEYMCFISRVGAPNCPQKTIIIVLWVITTTSFTSTLTMIGLIHRDPQTTLYYEEHGCDS